MPRLRWEGDRRRFRMTAQVLNAALCRHRWEEFWGDHVTAWNAWRALEDRLGNCDPYEDAPYDGRPYEGACPVCTAWPAGEDPRTVALERGDVWQGGEG